MTVDQTIPLLVVAFGSFLLGMIYALWRRDMEEPDFVDVLDKYVQAFTSMTEAAVQANDQIMRIADDLDDFEPGRRGGYCGGEQSERVVGDARCAGPVDFTSEDGRTFWTGR